MEHDDKSYLDGYDDGRSRVGKDAIEYYREHRGALPREKWRREALCIVLELTPGSLENL